MTETEDTYEVPKVDSPINIEYNQKLDIKIKPKYDKFKTKEQKKNYDINSILT